MELKNSIKAIGALLFVIFILFAINIKADGELNDYENKIAYKTIQRNIEQSKIEKNKTIQSNIEQSNIERNKVIQRNIEEINIKQKKAEQMKIEEINIKQRKAEQIKIEQTAKIKSKVVTKITNPFDKDFFNVKVSYYSEQEATNVASYSNKTALNQILFNNVIAVPYEIPLYSIFLIENKSGKQQIYIALDRGNRNYIKMLDDSKFKMKLDIYIKNADIEQLDKMGIDSAKCKILRLGPGNMTDFEENKKFVNMLNEKLENGESIESYFIKKETINT